VRFDQGERLESAERRSLSQARRGRSSTTSPSQRRRRMVCEGPIAFAKGSMTEATTRFGRRALTTAAGHPNCDDHDNRAPMRPCGDSLSPRG